MKHGLITILVLTLTPLLLRWLLSWLSRRFPAEGHGAADQGIEALGDAYERIVKRSILLWLLAAMGLIVALTYLLGSLGESRAGQLGDGEFTFVPDWPYWILPALFMGLTLAAVAAEILLRLILGPRYSRLARYDELKHGFGERASTWVYGVITALCLLLSAGLWDHYVVADDQQLRINGFLAVGERHCRYSDLVAIRTAPKYTAGWWVFAREHRRRHYLFEFADGCVFSTSSGPRGIPLEERVRLAEFISARSGVAVTELAAFTGTP